jgi:very-short-patch-repair endonuclease
MSYLYNKQNLKNRRKELRNTMPEPEQILWYYLRGKNLNGHKFRRQHSIGYYVLDFYCPKLRLAIEIDGDSHFIDSQAEVNDQVKEKFLRSQNIEIIRFTNLEVRDSIEGVIDRITQHLS